jgi:hypothetical protein
MARLQAQNQNVRAVGNMNVDAAGNTLDSHNQRIDDHARRVNRVYNKTTQNVGAAVRRQPPKAPPAPQQSAPQPPVATQAPQPAPAPDVAPPAAVIPTPATQSALQPDEDRNPLIRYPDEDDEDDIVDLADYDTEEPVGKETPKTK